MRMSVTYFAADGSVFFVSSPLAVATGQGGAYVQADYDLQVRNNWQDGCAVAVAYWGGGAGQSATYASRP